jgi:hypothetical protein
MTTAKRGGCVDIHFWSVLNCEWRPRAEYL